jgi:hypothetical protein
MKRHQAAVALVSVCFLLALSVRIVHSQGKVAPSTVQVHMVITDQAFNDKSEIAILRSENLQAKVGKDVVKIEHLIPARDANAALQLFVLIDDTCETSALGNNLSDLREFISAQPASTMVGVAYMSNATIQVTQNLTVDHALAGKALRLPRGSSSSMDSPYLSLVSLVKSWPQQKLRREVLMISDGIDRLRGDTNPSSPISSTNFNGRGLEPRPATTMPTISVDADTASNVSQRYGVIVHSIYATGVGRLGRNSWEAQLGQSGVAKITDETGGEYFALGTQNAVSFKPYLDRLQKIFDNQYFLVLQVTPRKKEGLQRVRISTEVANADIASANSVWVPASGG